jgi:hypothetical protein
MGYSIDFSRFSTPTGVGSLSYKYYLIEDEDNIGEWYIGTEQKNGAIEGRTCCENLQFAFEII